MEAQNVNSDDVQLDPLPVHQRDERRPNPSSIVEAAFLTEMASSTATNVYTMVTMANAVVKNYVTAPLDDPDAFSRALSQLGEIQKFSDQSMAGKVKHIKQLNSSK